MYSVELEKYFRQLRDNPGSEYNEIMAIRQSLLIINTWELERLISKTELAKEAIRNKDIIFVMGTTGAGKTTSILKLLNYNLVQTKMNGLTTYIPENNQVAKEHLQLVTSPEAKSCTRYIFGD